MRIRNAECGIRRRGHAVRECILLPGTQSASEFRISEPFLKLWKSSPVIRTLISTPWPPWSRRRSSIRTPGWCSPVRRKRACGIFFSNRPFYALEIERLKNIDVDKITRLIIVDNRNPARLGKLAAAPEPSRRHGAYLRPSPGSGRRYPRRGRSDRGGRRHDHDHGGTAEDRRGSRSRRSRRRSSPSAFMKRPAPSPLCRPPSGTSQAAAYLISQGRQLNIVSDFISRELTVEQVAILNNLIECARKATTSTVCRW